MAKGDVVVLARPVVEYDDSVLKFMGDRVERRAQEIIYDIGQEARDRARRAAPSKSGALRASIYVSKGQAPGKGGGAYTKQSTHAYFRAVNASMSRNQSLQTFDAGEGLVHPRTNRPLKSADTQFSFAKSTINGRGYRTYARHETIDFGGDTGEQKTELLTPSVIELGAAGRNQFFVTVGAAAYYAGWVEFGHITRGGKGYVEPHPFLGPAMEWAAQEAPKRLRAMLAEEGKT